MLQMKLVKFTCSEIIGIIAIYWVRHLYCTFEVGPALPKIDAVSPIIVHHLQSTPIVTISVLLPIHLNNCPPFILIS
jgi:hypothetical protein